MKKCKFCGKEIYGRKEKQYCNRKCVEQYLKEKFKGENNPFYRKHHTQETNMISIKNYSIDLSTIRQRLSEIESELVKIHNQKVEDAFCKDPKTTSRDGKQ